MNNTLNCANASLTHLCTVHINITKETKHILSMESNV